MTTCPKKLCLYSRLTSVSDGEPNDHGNIARSKCGGTGNSIDHSTPNWTTLHSFTSSSGRCFLKAMQERIYQLSNPRVCQFEFQSTPISNFGAYMRRNIVPDVVRPLRQAHSSISQRPSPPGITPYTHARRPIHLCLLRGAHGIMDASDPARPHAIHSNRTPQQATPPTPSARAALCLHTR